ncbi:TBC1 domain family member 7 [Eurytemora carolleeae]|uniref:TBC1 domain family member 7 n=1 Tax=Eurytemora carolleeae TaxID=1294199 RepID=UPI000C776977|nr:TBC1 domain family member 7 [Eurytemora carolleeae]|eukprot:XP_023325865.1 TBC1 domain family member 7-like [Eurytemora affinis]
MAVLEKNFRSHYYEKVGFRGVEEKKSLDILLNEKPIDREKLHNFCLRFAVPGIYRSSVWRVLLGIIPVYCQSQELVWNIRTQLYTDLEKTLSITRKLCKDNVTNLTFIWLLNSNKLKFDIADQLMEQENENFRRIISALLNILQTEPEVLWVGSKLHEFLWNNSRDWRGIRDCMLKLLKEDGELVAHLELYGLLDDISGSGIISAAFSTMLQPYHLSRLWDKVIAGSFKVLLYTLSAFLDRFRTEVLKVSSLPQLLEIMSNMTEVEQETVLMHGIDVWEMDGCPLVSGAILEPRPIHPFQPRTENRLSREINVAM